ncbi:MAG: mechanosensitive ion channel domain-containing protein [Halorhabdus sp.]
MLTVLLVDVVETMVESFVTGVVDVLPNLVAGLLFVTVAYVAIKLVIGVFRKVIERFYPPEQRLIVDFFAIVVATFLWFGVGLVLLNIVGLGEVAASLGTAAGFIGLGVSYALSNMIADTVAGVYLLRDPDFNEGDTVTTESVTGTVTEIGLRKSRFRTDEGIVILANRSVEARWTKKNEQT